MSTPNKGIVQPGSDKINLNLFSRFFGRDANVFLSIGEVHLVDASGKEHCFYTGHYPANEFTFSKENANLARVNHKLAFYCNGETIYVVLAGHIDLLTGDTVVDVEIESQTDVKAVGYVLYMGEKNKETKIEMSTNPPLITRDLIAKTVMERLEGLPTIGGVLTETHIDEVIEGLTNDLHQLFSLNTIHNVARLMAGLRTIATKPTAELTQEDIFEAAVELTHKAEATGMVIKLNMPTAAEVATFKTKRFLTVTCGTGSKVLMDPIPNETGCLLPGT